MASFVKASSGVRTASSLLSMFLAHVVLSRQPLHHTARRHAGDEDLQRFARRGGAGLAKNAIALAALDVNAVEHDDVKMRVSVQTGTESVSATNGSCLRTGVPCTLRPRPVVQRERLAEDAA